MDIIQSLGLDQTLIFQFCLFIVTYLLLSKLVFEPYFKSFEMRKAKTVGNQQLAMKTLEEIKNLQLEYEQKTREINEQYRTIYEKVKKESTK